MPQYSAEFKIAYADKVAEYTKTGAYTEIFNVTQKVDNTDGFIDILNFNPDTMGSSTLGFSEILLIGNPSNVTAEVQINTREWTAGTPDSGGTTARLQSALLPPNQFIVFSNPRLLSYSADTSSAQGATLTALVPATVGYVDSTANLGAKLENTETQVTASDGDFFKTGDLIQVGINSTTATEAEVMRVTRVAGATLTVERALFGTITADGDTQTDATNGAVSGANIHFPIFNEYADWGEALYGSSQLMQTTATGNYKISNFFGYGRTATQVADGIVPGSVAVKFYNSAYQNFGFKRNITAGTSTGLTASTTYSFGLIVDDSSETDIDITTDSSNVNFGGTNGVISKIQDAMNTALQATFPAVIGIVNGDLRITSLAHLAPHDGTNGSVITISDKTGSGTGTDLLAGSSGIFPNDTALPGSVPARLPDNTLYNKKTGETINNTGVFLMDKGDGTLERSAGGSGTLNYETGAFTMSGCPANAQFVIYAHYGSAHSGGAVVSSGTYGVNMIEKISARSVNDISDAHVQVIGLKA